MGAGLFEGNVVVKIVDADGVELVLQPTILQSPEAGTGSEGLWEVEILLSVAELKAGKIIAFSPSPREGEGWRASDAISVTLNPKTTPDTGLENTPWILRSFAQREKPGLTVERFPGNGQLNAKDGKLSGLAGCTNYFPATTWMETSWRSACRSVPPG
jgi:hypothetical protein